MSQSRIRELVVGMVGWAGVATALTAFAQEHGPVPSGPAPILMTVREMTLPGAEAAHADLEAQYAATLDTGNGSQYYLGMGAITGSPQTVFLSGYSSLEELSEVHDHDEATMGEKLDSLDEQHSGTLAGVDTAIWRLRPNLSNPDPTNLARMRFMELIHIHVKLGHGPEFADLIKQIKESWMKVDPDFHYSLYQQTFGNAIDDSYLVVIPIQSLADLDKHRSLVAVHQKNMGEDAEKRMLGFESANYNSIESNLFAFTPSMSRLPQSWTKDDSEFWTAKPTVAAPVKQTSKTK